MVRKSYGRPSHRQKRSVHDEAKFASKQALRATISALEWLERGAPVQFLPEALDQIQLAERFLRDVLVQAGRIQGEPSGDDDADE